MKKLYKICALVLAVFFLAIGLNIYHDIHTTSQTMSHFNKPNQFSNQTKRKKLFLKNLPKSNLTPTSQTSKLFLVRNIK